MLTKIDHIGIAVNSLAESLPFYRDQLGMSLSGTEEVASQKVRVAFLAIGESKIELLESTDPEGPIGKFLEKKGQGIHHIAFAVEDVNQSLKEVESSGIQLIDKQSRKGAEGLNIGFLHPKSTFGVLTELCSK